MTQPAAPPGARTIDQLLAEVRTVDVIGGFVAWVTAGLPTVPATPDERAT
jgi:hypothetical protein